MSIAKKSIKWLLVAVAVFALVLTAVLTAGTGATARADEPTFTSVDAVVVATDGGVSPTYPNFLYGSARTITAQYYIEMPDVTPTTPVLLFAPVLNHGDDDAILPDRIYVNSLLQSVASLSGEDEYMDEDATGFYVELDLSQTQLSYFSGVSDGDPVTDKYLFTAEYDLPADASVGEYTFDFGSMTHFSLTGSGKYRPVLAAESFFIRNTVELPTPDQLTYNGSAQIAVVADDEDPYTISGSAQTNAGTYTDDDALVATLKDTSTTIWDLGDGNYSIEPQSINWAIDQLEVNLSFVNPETYTAIYDDEITVIPSVTHDGIVAADVAGFALNYTGLPSQGDAVGSYPLTITYTPNANYIVNAETGVNYVITVRSITRPESAGETYTFNGSDQDFEFTEDPLTDDEYIQITGATKKWAGNYTVTASLLDPVNTKWDNDTVADIEFPFIINKAAPVLAIVTPDADGDLRAYNGSAVTIGTENTEIVYEVTAADFDTVVLTPVWEISDGNGGWTVIDYVPTAAGEYRVKVSASETDNFTAGSSEYRAFAIIKANQVVTVDTNDKIYDGAAFGASEYSVTTNSGETFQLVTTASTIASQSAFTPGANAATYNFRVYIPGNANFNAYISEEQTVVISPLALTVTPANVASVNYCSANITSFNGDVVVTAAGDNATAYAAYLSNKSLADLASALTFTLDANTTVRNAGTYVDAVEANVTAVANDVLANFNFTSGTANAVVNKIANAVTYELENGDTAKTYDTYAVTAGLSDADIIYATLEGDGTASYTFYNDNAGAKGDAIAAPTLAGTYWIGVTVTEGTNHLAITEPVLLQFVIDKALVNVTFTYSLGDGDAVEIVSLSGDYYACDPIPAVLTFRYFDTEGFVFDDSVVTVFTLEMDGETLNASYFYNVGMGDADGDGVITANDVYKMKRALVGGEEANKITSVDAAWALRESTGAFNKVFTSALDVNGAEGFWADDIVAVREALATGYVYNAIVDPEVTGVTGQSVHATERQLVTTYEQFVRYVKKGYPIELGNDIDAANETFNETIPFSADIDLATYRLTVKGFSLSTGTYGATLRVQNGTLYTVTGITVTAPNGNVVVSSVNGYSYDGTVVNLAAYSASLHIESDVAFYIYKAQDPVTNEDYADVHAFIADVYPEVIEEATEEEITALVTTVTTLANTRMGETADRMTDIANIKNSDKSEAQKAEEINALDVKKAIIEVPIDTHVVVEQAASLTADKLVVKAQSKEVVTEEDVVKTFSIEVKNSEAEVVSVDITEVKETIETVDYYYVEEVAIAGETAKVDVISGENTQAEVKKYVAMIGTTGYETLQAAIDAAVNNDTIKLYANVANGTGLMTADDNQQKTKVGRTFTIDFNGYTYTVDGASVGSAGTETQAMHWGEKDVITLKNGSLVISVKGATVPNPANNKIIKMAMQNYAALTVKNMVLDFSNIVVRNYGTYTGADAPYSGLEIPLFNLNNGRMTIEDTTITMPTDSTKGVLIEIPNAATIKNSIINGYVSLGKMGSSVTVVDSTITGGVVSYFAGYGVSHTGNVYRVGGYDVTNYTEMQAALDAGALIINVMNDFNAPNPIAISSGVVINGNGYTITSAGNRIVNVTEPDLTIEINDLTLTSATSERGLNIWNNATGTDITLNNVTIDAHLYAINYVNGADNETLTINNSSITGWAAINAHCNNSTFTVTDSTLYGINRNCDSQYGFSTVVIDGDSLFGSQEGDHGVDNTFVFDGCTIIAEVTLTHQYWISFQYAATGNVASVVVNNCQILDAPNGNDKSADMKIDGTNNAVVMALSAEQYAIVAAKHFNITDNGNGTYTIMPKTANISYFGTPYNFYDVFENGWLENGEGFTLTDNVNLDVDVVFAENRAAAIAVSGGTFEMNLDGYTISGEGKILLPVGVTCVTDSQTSIASLFVAPEGEVLIESIDADGNYIYAVSKAYVKTKAEFTSAITAGAKEIVICADINLSMYTYNRDMDITIDLNGHTLTTTMTGITFSAARTLNIKDSSANGTGAINSTGNYAINMGTASTEDTEINIYGGTLTGKTSAAVKVNDGTLNVYGGTLTCPAADKYAILNYQGYAGTVNIMDGTFNAAIAVANNGTGTVNIYGGTFSADPSDFVASGYMAVEDNGTWTVSEAEITITTFAELKAAIADVNAGNIVYPTLIIANDIPFEEELTISKSVYIMGDGETKFIGYDASTKYDEAFYINVADEDQEITIDGIVFDHFCYYSNVANKTKATASAVKNGVAYITYGGDCPASTNLYITGCKFIGTARDMINASSTKGCKGFIAIEDCEFDATDRLSSTLNMLSFYGNADAELSVIITGCTFKEASEQNATWATSAIASFGNADLTIVGCEFIACQIGIAIDNTFDRLYSTSTYPVYYNTTVNLVENTYTNCYFGYYGEFFVDDASEIPEEAELYTDEPFTYGDNEATQFHFAAEYDVYEAGEAGEAKHRICLCYYVKAMVAVGGGEGAQGNPGLDD